MFPWKLALIGIVPIAGFGIGYPIVNKLNSSGTKEVKEVISNSQGGCLQILEGFKEGEEDGTKQFLVCKKKEGNEGVTFYLYDRSDKDKKEVTGLKVKEMEGESWIKKITFTLFGRGDSGGAKEEEVIRLTSPWSYEDEIENLQSNCRIDWDGRTMSCSGERQTPRKEGHLSPFAEHIDLD